MAEPQTEGDTTPRSIRAQQDHDIAVTHALTDAEYALAVEAAHVARAFAVVGLDFEARTFVATRVLESSVAEGLDFEHALGSSVIRGLIDRSAALSEELLAS
jgi:hypothetical protein